MIKLKITNKDFGRGLKEVKKYLVNAKFDAKNKIWVGEIGVGYSKERIEVAIAHGVLTVVSD